MKKIFIILLILILAILFFNGRSNSIKVIELPDEYTSIGRFSNGLAVVEKNEKYGYINENVEEVIPCIYEKLSAFSEGLAIIGQDNKEGFINSDAEIVIPCIYEDAWSFTNGMALVKNNNKYGCINKIGDEVIPCIYNEMTFFSEEKAFVIDGDTRQSFYINKSGEKIIELEDKELGGRFFEGLAVVKKGDEWRVIDANGENIIEFKEGYYIPFFLNGWNDFYNGFTEDMVVIMQNQKVGYMNNQGEIIPCIYDSATQFEHGIAVVSRDNKIFTIDKYGNERQIAKYEYVIGKYDNILIVLDKEKFGCIDINGNEILPCEYDEISGFEDGVATARKEDIGYYILKVKD